MTIYLGFRHIPKSVQKLFCAFEKEDHFYRLKGFKKGVLLRRSTDVKHKLLTGSADLYGYSSTYLGKPAVFFAGYGVCDESVVFI